MKFYVVVIEGEVAVLFATAGNDASQLRRLRQQLESEAPFINGRVVGPLDVERDQFTIEAQVEDVLDGWRM